MAKGKSAKKKAKKSGSKPKGRKLTAAHKKKMREGREKAARARKREEAAAAKPRPKTKTVKKAAARSTKAKKKKAKKKSPMSHLGAAHAAGHAARPKPKKRPKKKGGHKKAAAKTGPSRAAARRRSLKTVQTHGTIVVNGKPQPVNVRVSMAERGSGHHKKSPARRRSGGHHGHRGHHVYENPMTSRVTTVYENPMSGVEYAIGVGFAGLGMLAGSFLDRYLATSPVIAAMAAGSTVKAIGGGLGDAVTASPGLMRIGAQVVLAAVPLVGSHWAGSKVRSGLQGFSIGVGARLFTQVVEHYVFVKFFAPRHAAVAPATTGLLDTTLGGNAPSFIQRLYAPEIVADADKATVLALTPPGTVAGVPRGLAGRPQGVAAPYGRQQMVDPGPRATPRATPRAGVGMTTTDPGMNLPNGGPLSNMPGSAPGTAAQAVANMPSCGPCDISNLPKIVRDQVMSEGGTDNTLQPPVSTGAMGRTPVTQNSLLNGLGMSPADRFGGQEAAE